MVVITQPEAQKKTLRHTLIDSAWVWNTIVWVVLCTQAEAQKINAWLYTVCFSLSLKVCYNTGKPSFPLTSAVPQAQLFALKHPLSRFAVPPSAVNCGGTPFSFCRRWEYLPSLQLVVWPAWQCARLDFLVCVSYSHEDAVRQQQCILQSEAGWVWP